MSKPLGFGTITTALKRGIADPEELAEAVGWMKRLNKTASELAVAFGLRGGTDITGFSLLGHGWEIAQASGVGLRIDYSKVPFVSGAQRSAQEWIFPGGTLDNRHYYQEHVRFSPAIDEATQVLLFDAQTSGGLLVCVPPGILEALMAKAEQIGQPLWEIGEVVPGNQIEVTD
jgi:selenide,water dikinase